MISPEQIVMIVLGVIACFGGYSLFRSMASLWGFLLGGWIGYTLLPVFTEPSISSKALYQIIAFVSGGVVGAIIGIPMYFVVVFLSGAALGALFGIMAGSDRRYGRVLTPSGRYGHLRIWCFRRFPGQACS
jgi:hypothetical protein